MGQADASFPEMRSERIAKGAAHDHFYDIGARLYLVRNVAFHGRCKNMSGFIPVYQDPGNNTSPGRQGEHISSGRLCDIQR